MRKTLVVLFAVAFSQLACGGGGLAPSTLSGKTVEASESTATGSMLPVGTSELIFSSDTAGTIDGSAFTYTYTRTEDGAIMKGALTGSFSVDYTLEFTSPTVGTFIGTVTNNGTGGDTGDFVIR